MAGALAVGMGAVPADAIARQAELKPTLVLTVRPLTVDGSPGRPSSLERSAPEVTGTTYLMAGRRDLPENQLCYTRATSGEVSRPDYLEKALAEASYVWTIKTTALKYETGRHSFEIDWQRFDRGSQTAAASGKQQLTLADGETYLLDFLRGSSEAPCRTPAIAIEVTSGVREDPALADTILRYDLWLVRQHPSKGKETSHVIVTAAQGASVDFAFPTLRTDVPKVQPDQYDLNVATRVKGTLRGRLTRDGRVSLELATESSNNVERRAAAPPSGLRPRTGTGRKVLTLGLAETIQIELPQSTGYASVFGSEAAERAFKEQVSKGANASTGTKPPTGVPVAPHEGRLVVNYGPLFEGTKVSLILQVRMARDAEDPPVAKR
jgi:hypothetical protein